MYHQQTIPQSKIKDFCRPPLHKGAFEKGENVMDFYKVPIGFGMALAVNEPAMNAYSAMTEEQKQAIINKAHNVRSEKEMYDLVASLAQPTMQ
jgi:hypothetical protein